MLRRIILSLLLLCAASLGAQPNSLSFSFTITGQDANTSAAVYDSNGNMVRILWGGVSLPPGIHTRTWDGLLQDGVTPATAGNTYTIKVLINNVVYTYDGRLFTTEKSSYTSDRYGIFSWDQGTQMLTFTFVSNKGWFSSGYAEGALAYGYFYDMNRPQMISQNYYAGHIQFMDIANDGQWIYLMNRGVGYAGDVAWVTAIDAITGMPVQIPQGTLVSGTTVVGYPKSYASNAVNESFFNTNLSYLDLINWPTTTIPANIHTGIAVQRNSATCIYPSCGNLLAVAHGTYINLFDKRTGAASGTITPGSGITGITQMAFNSEGLWLIASNGLWLISNPGGTNSLSQPITGLVAPLSVTTNSLTGSIFVLDGGTHQQMFEYAVNTHSLMRTYGTAGGYGDCNPTITNDRLMLDQTYSTGASTPYRVWVRVSDTDDVWIADTGNAMRILHISPTNQYVERLIRNRPNYSVVVSRTQPTRFFLKLWEFDMDYTKPLLPGDPDPALGGNGSWTFAKNWQVCNGTIGGQGGNTPVQSVEQLSNGSTYMLYWAPGLFNGLAILPPSGPARIVTNLPGTQLRVMMLRNGDLASMGVAGTTMTFNDWPLGPFDSNNNPTWGASNTVATITPTGPFSYLVGDNCGQNINGGEPTSDGIYPVLHCVAYSTNQYTVTTAAPQPHLGGVKAGTNSTYNWVALPEVCMLVPDHHGGYPCTNSYANHNGFFPPMAEGKNIFIAYDGQGATWGNQYYHIWSDGLMVGQFGMTYIWPGNVGIGPTPFVVGTYGYNYADHATNIRGDMTTTVNGDIYLFHGDEGGFGPVHRWHMSNLASIREFSGSGVLEPGGGVILSQIPVSQTASPIPPTRHVPARRVQRKAVVVTKKK